MILKRKYLENKKIILQCFTCDYLFLFDRNIMDLQIGVFKNLIFLKEIDLKYNKIEIIRKNTFYGLFNLARFIL